MEFALPELMNREDVIKILNQRQLHVQNMNELTYDELLRVYKTFVMPLSKRPERSKKFKQTNCIKGPMVNYKGLERLNIQMECLDNSSNAMDIDFQNEESCNTKQLISCRMTSPVGEKRRQSSNDEDMFDVFNKSDYQYQLSSVTKRIRINSLS